MKKVPLFMLTALAACGKPNATSFNQSSDDAKVEAVLQGIATETCTDSFSERPIQIMITNPKKLKANLQRGCMIRLNP